MIRKTASHVEGIIERLIFGSRWVQLPIYLGLIVASVLYAWFSVLDVAHIVRDFQTLTEPKIMLAVLNLVDITMVANLVTMVVIGGYVTFVSKIDFGSAEDKPDWLQHVDANVLKIKVAGSLAGVSGIHLLKGFIEANEKTTHELLWQVIIHAVFLISMLVFALTDKILFQKHLASVQLGGHQGERQEENRRAEHRSH